MIAGAPPLIVGLGNPLGGDDSVGLAIADRLRSEGIAALSIPDPAALVDLLVGARQALLIDAVVGAGPPGTVIELSSLDLKSSERATPVSTHALSIPGAIAIAEALGGTSEIRMLGVCILPPDRAASTRSPEVEAAIPIVAARVRELARGAGG